MVVSAENFKRYLEGKTIKYSEIPADGERKKDVVRISYDLENGSATLLFFFGEDGTDVNIKCFSICKVDSDKTMEMYSVLNELNDQYRWTKFYVDNDDEVTVSGDAVISPEAAGEVCHELLLRFINIIDEALPRIMKARWA